MLYTAIGDTQSHTINNNIIIVILTKYELMQVFDDNNKKKKRHKCILHHPTHQTCVNVKEMMMNILLMQNDSLNEKKTSIRV